MPYGATLLWTIAAAITGSIVADMAVSMGGSRASRASDVRDKQIGRLGDFTGQWPVILGAGAAMLMAIAKWDEFWIANVIYLGLALSAVLSSATKVVVYRRSLPQW